MHDRRYALAIIMAAALGLLTLSASRPAAGRSSTAGPFVVGSTWLCPALAECRIEEVQGDWLRVSTAAALPGFPPSAIWIYAPTGQYWARK
jgi:hypothetical protein